MIAPLAGKAGKSAEELARIVAEFACDDRIQRVEVGPDERLGWYAIAIASPGFRLECQARIDAVVRLLRDDYDLTR